MPEFIVRPMSEADLPNVIDVHEEVASERRWIATEPPIDRAKVERRFRGAFIEGTGQMFVVEAGGAIVGSLGMTGDGLLDLGMTVTPDWRGRGVGSALMEAAIDGARRSGAYKITLQVWPHNEAAVRLYKKYGFEQEGYLRRHWRRRNGELWDAVVMGLLLDEVEETQG